MNEIEDNDSIEIEKIERELENLGSNALKPLSQRLLDQAGKIVPDELSSLPSSIDPTGIISILFSGINAYKAKRQYENLKYCIAYLIHKSRQYDRRIEPKTEEDWAITIMYFERCLEAYQKEKISIFYNIWINSIFKTESALDEKAHAFNLATSLTLDQIKVFKIVYHNQGDMSVNELAKKLGTDVPYARQLCNSLGGIGLLEAVNIIPAVKTSTKMSGSNIFSKTDYAKQFIEYIIEPECAKTRQIS